MPDHAGTLIGVVVEPADAGRRLDQVLADRIVDLSRTRVKALVLAGAVAIGGRTIGDPGRRVKPGEAIAVTVPPSAPAVPEGEAIALAIVHEDADLIVVDKPAGLVVHPAAGHARGTLVNALIAHCGASLSGIGGVRRPGIVHRLDKDTSGLLVVAKNDAAHKHLSAQFAAHGAGLVRVYQGVVWGEPERRRGRIDASLARDTRDRTRIGVTHSGGRTAVTHYAVEEVFAGADGRPVASLMSITLETGRTHQIRVHLAHIRHPVMGDATYGKGFKASGNRLGAAALAALDALGRQALHAAVLGFAHPRSGRPMRFEAALPEDVAGLLRALRGGARA